MILSVSDYPIEGEHARGNEVMRLEKVKVLELVRILEQVVKAAAKTS